MKERYIRQLKPCFGNKSNFFKKKLKKCIGCQFKTRCLLKVNGFKKYD